MPSPEIKGEGRFRLKYNPSLDGLRGISVLFVVFFHLDTVGFHGGWIGVDIFFLLSGFLITTLLLQEWRDSGKIRLKSFYLRRVLRLFPALVFLVLFTVIAFFIVSPTDYATRIARDGGLALLYTTNWIPSLGVTLEEPFKHTWSLSTEEQFYLLWPSLLLCQLLLRVRTRWIVITTLFIIIGFTALQGLQSGQEKMLLLYSPIPTLLTGCLFAFVAVHGFLKPGLRSGRAWSFLSYVSMGYLFWVATSKVDPAAWNLWGKTTLNLAAVIILVSLFTSPGSLLAKVLASPPLSGLGRISYGMYLWHFPLFCLYWDFMGIRGHILGEIILLAITLGATLFSYHVIEKPFLRMKKRFSSG